jgi:D-alanyl-D-alanine carboxypeptidase
MLRNKSASSRLVRVGVFGLLTAAAAVIATTDSAEARRYYRHHVTHHHSSDDDDRGSSSPQFASIIVDGNSGAVLTATSPDGIRHPASLTKIMTLYLLFERLDSGKIKLDTEMPVSARAADQDPTKLNLRPGQTIKVEDAIKGLVTRSANDAAVVIAEYIGGSEDEFAKMMTRKARALGMSRTVYRNASGLPNDEQITTARDMATLATHLIHDYPEYYGVFQTRYFDYAGRKYRNHNHLLFGYKGTDGIKTGYTRASGFNLTASVHRGDKHLVAVVLGGKTGSQRDAAMRALLDKHFAEASATKPNKEQLVAALVSPSGAAAPAPVPQVVKPAAPAPAPQVVEAAAPVPQVVKPAPTAKPELTSAEAELETFVSQSPAKAVKPSVALGSIGSEPSTLGTPDDEAQGDIGEPSDATTDSTGPRRTKAAKQKYAGAFHVQVGAYTSESEAESRLGVVQQRASDLLDGHLPFTTSFTKEGAEWYRARFAGFAKGDAQSVCDALKKMSVDCVVMKAE